MCVSIFFSTNIMVILPKELHHMRSLRMTLKTLHCPLYFSHMQQAISAYIVPGMMTMTHFLCCSLSLQGSYRQFHEMAEALAERLLDLHCRLLSLYVLQDADCLHWEDPRPFFEGERGSFVIQMWWLYMQGNKSSLKSSLCFKPWTVSLTYVGSVFCGGTVCMIRCQDEWHCLWVPCFPLYSPPLTLIWQAFYYE
jgi:hypothetical protein